LAFVELGAFGVLQNQLKEEKKEKIDLNMIEYIPEVSG
jgi:hypothetical protein